MNRLYIYFCLTLIVLGLLGLSACSKSLRLRDYFLVVLFVYFAGLLIGNLKSQATLAVSGACQLLGFIGLVLGLITWVRGKKETSEAIKQHSESIVAASSVVGESCVSCGNRIVLATDGVVTSNGTVVCSSCRRTG